MGVSIEVSRNTSIIPEPDALAYEKYKSAPWFDFDKRVKDGGLKLEDVPNNFRRAKIAEDTTRTVKNFPYLVFWGEKLIIGWEVKNSTVTMYALESGDGKTHVGKLHYRDGRVQQFTVRGEGLSSQVTNWETWVMLTQVFPQLKGMEMEQSERGANQTMSMVVEIVSQNEVKVKNHIAAMKRKTIRAMEALDED